jgi:hypothetical protein
MRLSALAGVLAFVLVPTVPAAQERGRVAAPPVLPEKVDSISAAAAAAQHRHDAQQKAWDRKMKGLAGTICTGC